MDLQSVIILISVISGASITLGGVIWQGNNNSKQINDLKTLHGKLRKYLEEQLTVNRKEIETIKKKLNDHEEMLKKHSQYINDIN